MSLFSAPSPTNKRRSRLLSASLLAIGFSLAGCGKGSKPDPASPDKSSSGNGSARPIVVVIPKGTTHSYWKAVRAGAQKAADGPGVDMVWIRPLREDDRAQQIAIVEQYVSEGVSGMLLAPLDDVALRRPVQSATEKKSPS